jgi:type IV pilus assembly protein PilB
MPRNQAKSPSAALPGPTEQTGAAFDPAHFVPDPEVARLLPRSVAVRFLVAPLAREGDVLRVALRDPTDLETLDYVAMVTGLEPQGVAVPIEELRELIQRIYGSTADGDSQELETTVNEATRLVRDLAEGSELPIVRLVDQILGEAARTGATDIHIQPEESETIVRTRVDGILRVLTRLPRKIHVPLTTRVKVMADLDISERRLPQDGEIQLTLGERRIDLRVSTVTTVWGENTVLRLLDHSRVLLGLGDLGYAKEDRERFEQLVQRPNGIILVTGPTGSGKSTTLYAALRCLDTERTNIMTLEDPVEYQLPGIRQCQIAEKAGFTFATGLRAFLRQDPDVILVGEMRDLETTRIAMRAALTGHLVLSTMHTTSAVGTISRLREMGIEDYLLAGTLIGILAQRLCRRLCPDCSRETEAGAAQKEALGIAEDTPLQLRRGVGCDACRNTGYRGRFAVYELLEVTPTITRALGEGVSQDELARLAENEGFLSLRYQGARRVQEGWTTLEELDRVAF